MKLNSISIDNVRCFRYRERVDFNEDFNIVIGPNGGGKSTLLDIISLSLNNFLMDTWRIQDGENQSRISTQSYSENVEKQLEKHLNEPNRDSVIKIELKVNSGDIQNMEEIYSHKDEFDDITSNYERTHEADRIITNVENWIESGSVDGLSEGDVVEYTIENQNLNNPTAKPESLYEEYLNSIDLFILLSDKIKSIELQPAYFYFPPYRGGGSEDREVSITSDDYYSQLHEYVSSTSKEQASAISLAQFKLATQKRRYEHSVGDFSDLDEVKSIKKSFDKIGFDWSMNLKDDMNNTYAMSIEKGGNEYRIDQMSSGEREITNFLLGILSTDIQNGLIIIDEPELHLHPRWQSLLLSVLNDLEELTGNQFVFTTHSPSFITRDSIRNVVRVNKDDELSSRASQVNENELSDVRDLIHVIHSSNNEKMFFADLVVLVEGASDRVIFESLVEYYKDIHDSQEVIEVLKVDGKGNFSKYSSILENLDAAYVIIADLDFVASMDDPKISDIIDSQRRKVKQSLTTIEEQRLDSFIDEKKSCGVYLLPNGELEDHLPYQDDKVENALQLTKPLNFRRWLSVPEIGTVDLMNISKHIVERDIKENRDTAFPRSVRHFFT